jgi:hypothetical protein
VPFGTIEALVELIADARAARRALALLKSAL